VWEKAVAGEWGRCSARFLLDGGGTGLPNAANGDPLLYWKRGDWQRGQKKKSFAREESRPDPRGRTVGASQFSLARPDTLALEDRGVTPTHREERGGGTRAC